MRWFVISNFVQDKLELLPQISFPLNDQDSSRLVNASRNSCFGIRVVTWGVLNPSALGISLCQYIYFKLQSLRTPLMTVSLYVG